MSSYRIVLLGEGGVGKSALTTMFLTGKFIDVYDPTIDDTFRKSHEIDNERVFLDIIDTAGQLEFKSLRDQYIRDALKEKGGFVIVYSITQRSSFDKIIDIYNDILRIKEHEDINDKPNIMITGNKCDLVDNREIQINEGQKFSNSIGAGFYETSAKMDINVENIFYDLVRIIKKNEQVSDDKKEESSKCHCHIL